MIPLARLLSLLRPWFTGSHPRDVRRARRGRFLARVGRHSVTGCLVAAGRAGVWHHAGAHRFFSRARWSVDALGLLLLDLALAAPVPDGEPSLLAVDDTLLRRSGRKVFGSA